MLVTLLIEFLGAVYVCWRYKFNQVTQLIVSLLLCLGVFQLAEFFICTKESSANFFWARIGHVAITLLPPLGLQLIFCLAHKKSWWLWLLYALPVAFSGYFLFIDEAITSEVCLGNYVIFTSKPHALPYWGAYYYSFLLSALVLSGYWRRHCRFKRCSQAFYWVSIAYLAFLLPTTTINLLAPETLAGIPSIMCGFAVLMALILLGKITPLVGKQRKW